MMANTVAVLPQRIQAKGFRLRDNVAGFLMYSLRRQPAAC
jgi:hypothetical protein